MDTTADNTAIVASLVEKSKHASLAIAQWLEGFLYGSGLVLIHHPQLWAIINKWVMALSAEDFVEVLPLLRRSFAKFSHCKTKVESLLC